MSSRSSDDGWLNSHEVHIGIISISCIALTIAMIDIIILDFSFHTAWIIIPLVAMLLLISYQLYSIEDTDKKIDMIIDEHGYDKVETFHKYPNFYDDMKRELWNADSSVYLTHIRHDTPDDFNANEASEWFEEVEKWADKNPGTPIRRLTTVNDDNMMSWGREMQRRMDTVSNFDVNVIDWEFDFPMVNFVVFDEKIIYFTFTSDGTEQTRGAKIVDEDLARLYVDYFNYVWNYSEDIKTAIDERSEVDINGELDLSDPND